MLKKSIVFIIALFVFAMVGCVGRADKLSLSGGDPLADRQFIDDGWSFDAKILEFRGTYVLVEPLEGQAILSSGDRVSFGISNLNEIDASVGDYVTIRYDGRVMESYPLQIVPISWSILQKGNATVSDM